MSDLRTAAQQALEALLESVDLVQNDYDTDWQHRSPSRAAQMNGKRKMLEAHTDAITALRAALAEPIGTSDYPNSHQRKPLTDAEIEKILIESAGMTVQFSAVDLRFARAIEHAHGIKENP